tara:strand:+ start:785 stop:1222 length:438 start_codon:yes stop_codon:yes gene_type:complete
MEQLKPPKIFYKNGEEVEELIRKAKTFVSEKLEEGVELMDLIQKISVVHHDYGAGETVFANILLEAFKILTKGYTNEWMEQYAMITEKTIVNTIITLDDHGHQHWNISGIIKDIFLWTFVEEGYGYGDDARPGDIFQIVYFESSE